VGRPILAAAAFRRPPSTFELVVSRLESRLRAKLPAPLGRWIYDPLPAGVGESTDSKLVSRNFLPALSSTAGASTVCWALLKIASPPCISTLYSPGFS
jgi:hypothetical protein